MADNITILDGTGTARVVAAADVGSVYYQKNDVQGFAAHDAAVDGNPVLLGAEARGADNTAVSSGDAARLIADRVGKLVVMPYATSSNIVSGKTAAITGTSNTEVIAAPGAAISLYITTLIFTNSHASTGTEIVVKDGTTELFRVYAKASESSFAINFPTPLKLSINTALNAANITTSSNTYVAAVGFKASV